MGMIAIVPSSFDHRTPEAFGRTCRVQGSVKRGRLAHRWVERADWADSMPRTTLVCAACGTTRAQRWGWPARCSTVPSAQDRSNSGHTLGDFFDIHLRLHCEKRSPEFLGAAHVALNLTMPLASKPAK